MINLSNLNQYRESEFIEAKKALGGIPESLWETYSAFANSCGGVILLGVREESDRTLHAVNLPAPKAMVRDLWEDFNNPDIVSVNILTEEDITIEDLDGNHIIVVNVPPAEIKDKPVYIGNDIFKGTYCRIGDGDFRCSEEEIREMLKQREKCQ